MAWSGSTFNADARTTFVYAEGPFFPTYSPTMLEVLRFCRGDGIDEALFRSFVMPCRLYIGVSEV